MFFIELFAVIAAVLVTGIASVIVVFVLPPTIARAIRWARNRAASQVAEAENILREEKQS